LLDLFSISKFVVSFKISTFPNFLFLSGTLAKDYLLFCNEDGLLEKQPFDERLLTRIANSKAYGRFSRNKNENVHAG
jgi:hypothetical protein